MSDYTHWHVGMKVVCVGDQPQGLPGTDREMHGLRQGSVYTIRAIGEFHHPVAPGFYPKEISIWLKEILRPPCFGVEVPYSASRFRPVKKHKTDISIFREMLTKTPEELREYDEVALW